MNVFNDMPMLIPALAILYLLFIHLVLSLAQRSKKVLGKTNNDIINSSQTMEN